MKDNLHTYITQEIIDNKDRVACDCCNKEFTDADTESGGFLFGSYAYCPACAKSHLPKIKGYNEEHCINAWCPPELSFRQWVLDRLRRGNNLTIITTKERESTMTKEQAMANQLCEKWIEAERKYRDQVSEAMSAGTPFTRMSAHADQLRECRRELQTAFGLVAREKDKGHL